jgi:peptide/nickel transport system permease protein
VGVSEPGELFLFGTDEFGRDLFSRFLYGGRRALLAGLLAALAAVCLGCVAGAVAGFYGGWPDVALMRCSELCLSLPLVYVLLAIRALMPLHLGEFGGLLVVVIVAVIAGWPRPARLVRGVFLTVKERPYVFVARSLGASNSYLISRHIFPDVQALLWIQVATLLPQFMLVDVTFSFLGLGAGEPNATWGGLLAALRHFSVVESHHGYLIEATCIAIILFFLQLIDLEQIRREQNQVH